MQQKVWIPLCNVYAIPNQRSLWLIAWQRAFWASLFYHRASGFLLLARSISVLLVCPPSLAISSLCSVRTSVAGVISSLFCPACSPKQAFTVGKSSIQLGKSLLALLPVPPAFSMVSGRCGREQVDTNSFDMGTPRHSSPSSQFTCGHQVSIKTCADFFFQVHRCGTLLSEEESIPF